ncbi:GlxA family transcriptional regulator [Ralstonia soli]|uniref:GlxA family transcriptional regulator n=1 Tax=Ralstonia soli TaxID=2953896 RepID=A0ABT1ALX3_9RALS|nr:GlxA family transcriptional regulator [Ralstonia soli]MCO5399234.1 GlxA family transcriptional regulator [Ralstonia soli]
MKKTIGIVLYPGFQVLGLAVSTVFEFANATIGRDEYAVTLVSEHGGSVPSSMGFGIDTAPLKGRKFHTLIVSGDSDGTPQAGGVTQYVRHALRSAERVAATCTGAFVLAEAGLLDGRRATTHWHFACTLQRDYPNVKVEEDRIFIVDGPIWTSAGATAGIDLALALVEHDLGAETARLVAKKLVVYHRRAGGQSQFSALLELDPKSDRVQTALSYAKSNLTARLSVEDLAEVAHLSPRQFSRVFREETGQSPARAIEHLRLEAARLMMESGRHPIEVIVRETGFGDRERMRRSFLRAYGQSPQAMRRLAAGSM